MPKPPSTEIGETVRIDPRPSIAVEITVLPPTENPAFAYDGPDLNTIVDRLKREAQKGQHLDPGRKKGGRSSGKTRRTNADDVWREVEATKKRLRRRAGDDNRRPTDDDAAREWLADAMQEEWDRLTSGEQDGLTGKLVARVRKARARQKKSVAAPKKK